MSFDVLGLSEPLLRAVGAEGYTTPTQIQLAAIPPVLSGRDLLGAAQTGTGKTAAFALPMLDRLTVPGAFKARKGSPRALVLTPTRELAIQVHETFVSLGRFKGVHTCVIYGGVGQRPQERELAKGPDVLVATPGRLLDLFGQGHVHLDDVEIFVLDEADRMLDLGFLPDVKRVIKQLPTERQSLFFSATLLPTILDLARSITRDPVRVEVDPPATTVDRIAQKVMLLSSEAKRTMLTDLLKRSEMERTLVFARTKHRANRLTASLAKDGVSALAIHGNKSQTARQNALAKFKTGETPVLVATDIAARGIDVDGISHVINFDLPMEPESYVHRIGRTARAGSSGVAVTLCEPSEVAMLRRIERLIGKKIEVVHRVDDVLTGESNGEPRPVRASKPRAAVAPRNGAPVNEARMRAEDDEGSDRDEGSDVNDILAANEPDLAPEDRPVKLFVGNLPFETTEDELMDLFTDHPYLEVVLVKESRSGRSRGFGFASFATADDARAAIEALDGHDVGGRPMKVREAKEDAPRKSRPESVSKGKRSAERDGPSRGRSRSSGRRMRRAS